MEATGISIGKSVLRGALNYAQSAVAEEVALQLGVQRDHSFIIDELEMMQGFLMAAHDERDDNKVVKIWVKQVRDVSYAVEDCVLDFVVRLEKQSWWCLARTVLARRYAAKQMKELRAKVEEVSQRNQRYHLIKGSSSNHTSAAGQPTISSATMSAADDARLLWQKAKMDLAELINYKGDALRVIALWGTSSSDLQEMSIIESAYEDPMIHKNFDCCALITLMCPFSQTDFIRSIVRQIYINSFQEMGEEEKTTIGAQVLKMMAPVTEDGLAYEFKRYLNDKSYLIVLNKINTIEDWDCIKTCFPDNKKGSRIIVSTEQVEVASLCIGAEDEALVRKKLFADQSLYAFYSKVSQEGRNSVEKGSTSYVASPGINSSAHKNILTRMETMSTLEEYRLIGRGNQKEEIIKLISNKDLQHFHVFSLWGMGGIGKTTLVTDIYQTQEINSMFDKRACVTVMRPFNSAALLESLIMQFRDKNEDKNETDLRRCLQGKRYLLVLDDLWSIGEWDAIKQYLPETAASCIIVTTREENIAKHCSKDERNIYPLHHLGPVDACTLFTKKCRVSLWSDRRRSYLYFLYTRVEMSDDDKIPECDYCCDDRGLCDREPHLQNGRFFTVKLEETFDVCTYIPCHARPFVLQKLGFQDLEKMETRRAHLRTKHGYAFRVKLYNALNHSHFGCSNWEAFCKAYGFEENMQITFDIRPEIEDIEDNIDIWVDVDMPPVLPKSYFLSSKNTRKAVDMTYYSYGSELNCEEKGYLVSFIDDVENFKTNQYISPNYTGYVPLVHQLLDGNLIAKNLKLPSEVVPHMMLTKGSMYMVSLRPFPPTAYQSAYSISLKDGRLNIKDWSKVMKARTQPIGDNMRVRKPEVGDRWISILHFGDGPVYLFYAILPRREE